MLDAGESHSDHPFAIMRGRKGWYDPEILEVFAVMRGSSHEKIQMLDLSVREVTRGQEVTPARLERMRNFSPELAIREPVRMILQSSAGPATQPVLSGSRA